MTPETMSGSIVISQPGFLLRSKAHVTTKAIRMSLDWAAAWGNVNVQALGSMEELAMVVWVWESWLWLCRHWRAGLDGVSVRELALSCISCSTWESLAITVELVLMVLMT